MVKNNIEFTIYNFLNKYKNLPPLTKIIWIFFLIKNKGCFERFISYSYKDINKETGVSKKTIYSSTNKLSKTGLLEKKQEEYNKPNRYKLKRGF